MLEFTKQLAKDAGALLLQYFNKKIKIDNKEQTQNLVTEADLASEKFILSKIKEKYPDHGILAEESGKSDSDSEYVWIVDPLDGTNNFAHGFGHFAVSIACYKNNEPVVGVVYNPVSDELFCAELGQGAFLNGEKITVSSASRLSACLLVTGFYYERDRLMRQTLKDMERFFEENVHGIRRTGSAALDLCYVAAGRFDGYWERKLSPWDFAAGALIVAEAGGVVSDVKGLPYSVELRSICASNPSIANDTLQILRIAS